MGASDHVGLSTHDFFRLPPQVEALLGPGWGSCPKVGGAGRDTGKSGGGALPKGSGLRKPAELKHVLTRMLLLWLRALCRRFQHVPRRVPCRQVSRGAKASRAG